LALVQPWNFQRLNLEALELGGLNLKALELGGPGTWRFDLEGPGTWRPWNLEVGPGPALELGGLNLEVVEPRLVQVPCWFQRLALEVGLGGWLSTYLANKDRQRSELAGNEETLTSTVNFSG
jgi:hypothetical protein